MLSIECREQGDVYIVISASVRSYGFNSEAIRFQLEDTRAFSFIVENLADNKTVSFPKGTTVITRDILTVEDTNNIIGYKHTMLFLTEQLASNRIPNINFFDFYKFTKANNALIDKGYFITDENREEKYIEILETEDEQLINMLEVYLTANDKFGKYDFLYNQLRETQEQIEDASTIEEVTEIYNQFKAKFN